MRDVTVLISEHILNRLDAVAGIMGQSRDHVMARAIEAYLSSHEWFLAAVREGVCAADEGRMASPEEVDDVFRKWGVNRG